MGFSFASSYVALWVWAIFQGLLTLAILRQVMELEKRSVSVASGESLIGTHAPVFSGVDSRSGQTVDLGMLDQGGVILFLAGSCTACRQLAKDFQDAAPGILPPMVAVCIGGQQQSAKIGKRLGQIPLLLQGAEEVASLYRVSGYPSAVVLDGKRMILAHRGINTVEDLRNLVAQSQGRFIGEDELALVGSDSRQSA